MKQNNKNPYEIVGAAVSDHRRVIGMSQRELSEALEISVSTLGMIERGVRRPSREVLTMLFSIFKLSQGLRDRLWGLCGFDYEDQMNIGVDDKQNDDSIISGNALHKPSMSGFALLPLPVALTNDQILYTDSAHVVVNNYGVIIEFKQGRDNTKSSVNVARLGMSKEHAISLIGILTDTLNKINTPDTPK